jgi:NADH-quinone oxidoreductase subunit L
MVAAFGLGGGGAALMQGHERALAHHGNTTLLALTSLTVLNPGVGAAMFHLTTHAFFKALLFLGSGSVILGCHHEQDIFRMGGLRKAMPVTFWTFTIGVMAIIGLPGLAGFFSKDAILYLAMEENTPIFALLTLTAVLTAFYMIRLWKLVFFGQARSPEAAHAHESGMTMTLPLIVLASLAITGGYMRVFSRLAGMVARLVPEAEGSDHTTILLVSLAVLLVGGVAGWRYYKSAATDSLEEKSRFLFHGLKALQASFDAVYDYYVAKVQQRFAMLVNFLEQIFLAGAIVRGLAGVVGYIGIGARALYVGSLHAYVYWFLLGLVLLWGFAVGFL